MKKFIEILFGRALFLIIGFFIQILAIVFIVLRFQAYFFHFYIFSIAVNILLLFFIINKNMNPSYKIAWILTIMSFPSFGWILYILFSTNRFNKILRKKNKAKYNKYLNQFEEIFKLDKLTIEEIKKENEIAYGQANYLAKFGYSSAFKNRESVYFKVGEDYHEALLNELKKAKKFIFMEYFIISQGKMWDSILEILKEKVKEGVEVRIIYDDFGCIMTLPYNYYKLLEKEGIKCSVFNPANFIFSTLYNNRTHRKITVIDGVVAFTGGINVADEYINSLQRFGHWKDTGILIKGEGVWSFTVMFLNVWNFIRKTEEDFFKYRNQTKFEENLQDGYVVPFSDSPLDQEIVSSNLYISLINNATRYIYINTPYLIIDHEMYSALSYAAKRGVDVRIVTPHIPDKKAVFEVTRSNYLMLIKNGVKIYEYLPGFIHAKSFVVDDLYSVVGTINLDYRSLFLHFECGLWLYNSKTIFDIKRDYLETLEKCKLYTLEECKNISKLRTLYRSVLKVFAPLM